jgi:CAAX protease family protein
MAPIRDFVTRHAAPVYFTLAFAISWSGVLIATAGGAMSGASPASDPRFVYALVAMLAGPSIAGVLLTATIGGAAGLRDLLARAHRWQVAGRWYAIALLAAPVLWSATLFALSIVSPRFLPALVTSGNKVTLVAIGFAVATAAGIFEEIGWTGFAIPHLLRRHSLVRTGLIVGVLWGSWHLLTNVLWAAPATTGDLPLSTFLPWSVLGGVVGYLAAFRVLMVWVYERTGSALIGILMHVSLTASVLILEPAGLTGVSALISSYALAAAVWIAVAVVAALNRRRPLIGHETIAA